MDCLITGGAGFIGSRLGSQLIAAGRGVVAFDSLHPQVHARTAPVTLPDGVTMFAADATDPEAWDRLFALHGPPRTVFHLAAETGTGQSLREATRHGAVNVVGTTQLIDALSRHDVRPERMMLTSSRAVYGEGAWLGDQGELFYPPPRSEAMLAAGVWDPVADDGGSATPVPHAADTTWPRPSNVYGATKLAQEHVLEAWCSAFSVPLSILRLQNVFGPGQSIGNAYTGVLTFFARQLAMGERLDVYEDGRIIRDFVFVDDVVRALLAAVERPVESLGSDSVERFDVGSGQAVTLLEVATTMSDLGSAPPPHVSGRFRKGDVRAASADIAPIVKSLGWTPTVPLDQGLDRLLQWVASKA